MASVNNPNKKKKGMKRRSKRVEAAIERRVVRQHAKANVERNIQISKIMGESLRLAKERFSNDILPNSPGIGRSDKKEEETQEAPEGGAEIREGVSGDNEKEGQSGKTRRRWDPETL